MASTFTDPAEQRLRQALFGTPSHRRPPTDHAINAPIEIPETASYKAAEAPVDGNDVEHIVDWTEILNTNGVNTIFDVSHAGADDAHVDYQERVEKLKTLADKRLEIQQELLAVKDISDEEFASAKKELEETESRIKPKLAPLKEARGKISPLWAKHLGLATSSFWAFKSKVLSAKYSRELKYYDQQIAPLERELRKTRDRYYERVTPRKKTERLTAELRSVEKDIETVLEEILTSGFDLPENVLKSAPTAMGKGKSPCLDRPTQAPKTLPIRPTAEVVKFVEERRRENPTGIGMVIPRSSTDPVLGARIAPDRITKATRVKRQTSALMPFLGLAAASLSIVALGGWLAWMIHGNSPDTNIDTPELTQNFQAASNHDKTETPQRTIQPSGHDRLGEPDLNRLAPNTEQAFKLPYDVFWNAQTIKPTPRIIEAVLNAASSSESKPTEPAFTLPYDALWNARSNTADLKLLDAILTLKTQPEKVATPAATADNNPSTTLVHSAVQSPPSRVPLTTNAAPAFTNIDAPLDTAATITHAPDTISSPHPAPEPLATKTTTPLPEGLSVYFAHASYEISAQDLAAIQQQKEFLNAHPDMCVRIDTGASATGHGNTWWAGKRGEAVVEALELDAHRTFVVNHSKWQKTGQTQADARRADLSVLSCDELPQSEIPPERPKSAESFNLLSDVGDAFSGENLFTTDLKPHSGDKKFNLFSDGLNEFDKFDLAA